MRVGAILAASSCLAFAPAALAHPGDETDLGQARAPLATASQSPAAIGSFTQPFAEPTISGRRTDARCIEDKDGVKICKPAAGSVTVLESGKVLYWNALEGTERVQASIVAEYGSVALNDQSRLLDLGARSWTVPKPADAGANPEGYENDPLVPGGNSEHNNDGALFCSDMNLLPDGRVLAVGGTAYYHDPEIADTGFGVSELEGLRNSRIYDPETDTWSQTGALGIGRWYPTLVSLGDGDQFVASGVQKLIKPVYPDRPEGSGTNVKQTETYDTASGRWADNGATAQRSLPLFPRLHLLPNGHVFFNAAGQSFNPAGQSYDEALWNVAASYDPKAKEWKDLGVPGLEGGGLESLQKLDSGDPARDLGKAGVPGGGSSAVVPGFRGSTFSVMLPLRPDARGRYEKASFLTAGGVLNPPSPGSHVTTSDSRLTTVDTANGDTMSTRATGDFGQPRWYPSGVLLPTGEAIAFSGADRDEVTAPSTEFPVKQAELFDPKSETWKPLASAHQPRTYHNTAVLLPDGRVLIGGHAPITSLYLKHQTLPGGFAPNDGRDPSFEIYSPPYLFRGERPGIVSTSKPAYGREMSVRVDRSASEIESVVLVRNPSQTHVIDGDQRSVELRVLERRGDTLTVAGPPNGNVAPPGSYMLFVNHKGSSGPVPSKAAQVSLR